jgi:hypothetical protein
VLSLRPPTRRDSDPASDEDTSADLRVIGYPTVPLVLAKVHRTADIDPETAMNLNSNRRSRLLHGGKWRLQSRYHLQQVYERDDLDV